VLVLEEMNLLDSPQVRNIHMVGIGGSSMSGLAEILISLGYRITGSDMKASSATEKLGRFGVEIHIGHCAENVTNPDLVVYTVAVKEDNPEMIKARSMGVPVIDRAVLLGQLMKRYEYSIAISGTHGKTTTTSMITMIMLEADKDPTVHIGGELEAIGGNTKIGSSGYFITEACEYYESFLKFHPYIAVILNIEVDHVDYFKGIDHIRDTFYKFASLVPNEGYLVACMDDSNTRELLDQISCRKITYGVKSENAKWSARDITFDELGCASYTLLHDKKPLDTVKLNVPGIHNVNNSLAAIAASHALGCGLEDIKRGLARFGGAHRRFELKGIADGAKVIDDYAHHPTEVKATLKAAKNCGQSKIRCVFQPHTYTRTKAFIDDFATAFFDADQVIVTDIYAAREPDRGEINSSQLTEKINAAGGNALYIRSFDEIVNYLLQRTAPGEMILTMGAGDVYKVGELYLEKKQGTR
jgi:UDP-N-acetylmuramate--alanine ligase